MDKILPIYEVLPPDVAHNTLISVTSESFTNRPYFDEESLFFYRVYGCYMIRPRREIVEVNFNAARSEIASDKLEIYDSYYRGIAEHLKILRSQRANVYFLEISVVPHLDQEVTLDAPGTSGQAVFEPVIGNLLYSNHKFVREPGSMGNNLIKTFGKPNDGIHAIQMNFREDLFMQMKFPDELDRKTTLGSWIYEPTVCLGSYFCAEIAGENPPRDKA